MISLQDYYNAVSGAITSGNLALDLTQLQSDDCTAIANAYLPNNTLTVNTVILSPIGTDQFTLTGAGVSPPLGDFSVSVVFFLSPSGDAELTITANAPPGWKFDTGFPTFAGSIMSGDAFGTSNPQITLSTIAVPAQQIPSGMFFSGIYSLSAASSLLSLLLNNDTVAPVSGPVVMIRNGAFTSSLTFTSQPINNVSIFVGTIPAVTLQLSYAQVPNAAAPLAIPFLTLTGSLPFTSSTGSYEIPLSATINTGSGMIRFQAMISGLIQAALNDLSAFLAGQSLDSYLPPDFRLDSILQLTNLSIDYNPLSTNSISAISLSIANRSPWTLMRVSDKDLVTDKLIFTFSIISPFSNPTALLTFYGEVALGDLGTMCIQAIGPSWGVQGYLKQGSVLLLTEVIDLFLGAPSGAPPMVVNALNFSLSGSSYSLEVSLMFYWFPSSSLQVYLNSVYFQIEHTPQYTSGAIEGVFDFTVAELALSARYPGQNGAWILSGGTAPDTSIKIADLLTSMASAFGVDQTVPAALESFVISELGLTYNTLTSDFTFHCRGDFTISDIPVTLTVDIKVLQQSGGTFSKTFSGKMVLDGKEFDLIFDTDPTQTTFIAEYYNLDGSSIAVKDLVSTVTGNQTLLGLIPDGLAFSIKDALFAWNSVSGTSDFLFAMDWGMGVSLSNLPIVGQYFGPDETLDLAFQVTYASDAGFTTAVINDLNTLVPPNTIIFPPQDIPAGINLYTQVRLGGTVTNIALPVGVDPNSGQLATTGDGTWGNNPQPQWFSVQKTFGPVYFNRVGVLYNTDDSNLYFYLDASFTAGGLNITLDGLSLNAPITEFWNVSFGLTGMGVDYRNGALQIGGAFLHSQKTVDKIVYDEYAGTAIIQFENFGLAALGAYADFNRSPSMFIYGQASLPLGGPPFFMVTGLAAGFGYNRSLTVPTLDTMLDFPLVQTALQLSAGGSGSNFTAMLQSLGKWIPSQIGEYWLAAGITFTSFNIIDSFVLLTVAFGEKFQLNVFGLSTMIAPPNAGNVSAIAEIQLAIIATLDWDSGYLGVTGQLTKNSFLFSRNAKLTGGFAMCTWFSGEHAGDFVVTVGGYHPLFNVPSYYPKVPRLGFNWQVDSNLLLKGEMYFALTPSAIMAGGLLQATWTSGDFRAWFSAHADFIVAWKPYYYNASMAVTIGASYTFNLFGQRTISADVGAALSIWGPDFSGTAEVDLGIISFTVAFGAAKNTGPVPIAFSDFTSSFLPANPVSITAVAGIVGQAPDNNVIINPATFALNIDSAIPLQNISSGGTMLAGSVSNSLIGVAPMNAATSAVTIQLTATITSPTNESLTQLFTFTSASKNFPAALWGTALQPKVNSPAFISNVLSGFTLTAIPVTPGYLFTIAQSELALELFYAPDGFSFAAAETETLTTGEANRSTISTTITSTTTATQRNLLLSSLNIDATINLTTSIGNMFINAPVIIED